MLLSSSDENISINVDEYQIYNSQHKKLPGITIANDMKFDEHVLRLCKKASQKLHALARVSNFMSVEKRRKIMIAFIASQLGYCPVVWMFHSRMFTKISPQPLNNSYKKMGILPFVKETFSLWQWSYIKLLMAFLRIL